MGIVEVFVRIGIIHVIEETIEMKELKIITIGIWKPLEY